MSDSRLVDPFGRRITYLRLSVTDRCDFRRTYCMSEDIQFLPATRSSAWKNCTDEPSLHRPRRAAFVSPAASRWCARASPACWHALGQRAELEDLAITTNGSQLRGARRRLKAAGVRRLNVSLTRCSANASPPSPVAIAWSRCWTASRRRARLGFETDLLNCGWYREGRNDDEIRPGRVRPWPTSWTSVSSRKCRWAASPATVAN